MSERERFELWASAPPYEANIHRAPDDCEAVGWPGQYEELAVQLAWEAWQAGRKCQQEKYLRAEVDAAEEVGND